MTRQQVAIHLGTGDQAHGVEAEQPAKMLRRNPINLDEHMRRAGDVGRTSGVRRAASQDIRR